PEGDGLPGARPGGEQPRPVLRWSAVVGGERRLAVGGRRPPHPARAAAAGEALSLNRAARTSAASSASPWCGGLRAAGRNARDRRESPSSGEEALLDEEALDDGGRKPRSGRSSVSRVPEVGHRLVTCPGRFSSSPPSPPASPCSPWSSSCAGWP